MSAGGLCGLVDEMEGGTLEESIHASAMEKAVRATVLVIQVFLTNFGVMSMFACVGDKVRGADRWSDGSGLDRRRRTDRSTQGARESQRPASSRERVGEVFTCKVIWEARDRGWIVLQCALISSPPARNRYA